MAWVKVPPEHHPLFLAALPMDPRIETLRMFGGIAAKVNGHLFAGLFGRSVIVSLSETDRAEALALDGAELFDPMGNGRVHSDKIQLPESVMDEPDELRQWLARSFDAAAARPKKASATAKKKKASAKAPAAKKSGAKPPAVKKPRPLR